MSSVNKWERWLLKQPAYHPAWSGAKRRYYREQHARRVGRWIHSAAADAAFSEAANS